MIVTELTPEGTENAWTPPVVVVGARDSPADARLRTPGRAGMRKPPRPKPKPGPTPGPKRRLWRPLPTNRLRVPASFVRPPRGPAIPARSQHPPATRPPGSRYLNRSDLSAAMRPMATFLPERPFSFWGRPAGRAFSPGLRPSDAERVHHSAWCGMAVAPAPDERQAISNRHVPLLGRTGIAARPVLRFALVVDEPGKDVTA